MIHDIDAGVQHGNRYIDCLIEAGSSTWQLSNDDFASRSTAKCLTC
jgi:hypothetical protein